MHLIKRIYHSAKTAICCKRNSAVYYEPQLMPRYANTAVHDSLAAKICIYMVDGTDYNPGLCDKLRGALSLFEMCQETDMNFKINWIFPFELTDYLLPNEYDWFIPCSEINYSSDSRPIVIDYAPYLLMQQQIDRLTFRKRILKSDYKQLHVYSNTILGRKHFRANFSKLFKASPKLSEALIPHKKALVDNYISFSFRFMELLGDFKDQEGISTTLPKAQQTELMQRCAEKLLEVLNNHPAGTKAFVASDSASFLDYICSKDDRIYIVPGEIVHIRYKGSDEAYMKTFVDLFLLKDASTQYLLRTGSMYNSGFPRFASWIGNGDFHLIDF